MAYDRIKCPECKADFGQEKKFVDHLADIHGITDSLQLYLKIFCGGIHPRCICSSVCDVKISWGGWKHGFTARFAKGHNARVDSVYLDRDRQAEFTAKRAAGYAEGKYSVWNKGLSKQSDERVMSQSRNISRGLSEGYASGDIGVWWKLFPEKADSAKSKMSRTKRRLYQEGKIVPWNKGLTKYDDPRVEAMSHGIKINYESNPDASAKRLTHEEFLERVSAVVNFRLLDENVTYRNKYQKFNFECLSCGEKQLKSLVMLEGSPVCLSCSPKERKL